MVQYAHMYQISESSFLEIFCDDNLTIYKYVQIQEVDEQSSLILSFRNPGFSSSRRKKIGCHAIWRTKKAYRIFFRAGEKK